MVLDLFLYASTQSPGLTDEIHIQLVSEKAAEIMLQVLLIAYAVYS
jgi:hypothetical protein